VFNRRDDIESIEIPTYGLDVPFLFSYQVPNMFETLV
jgi:hypothetical protein